MIIRFIKDTYHPRKRSLTPDYKAGFQYDLIYPDAQYYIEQGLAVPVEPSRELKLKVLRERATETPATNSFANIIPPVKKPSQLPPSEATINLMKTLGLIPTNPQNKISLPIRDPETIKALKNKELSRNMRSYFSDKEIPVKSLAGGLLKILDYAVEIKDDFMISKVAGDLKTLLRLTEFYRGKQDDR